MRLRREMRLKSNERECELVVVDMYASLERRKISDSDEKNEIRCAENRVMKISTLFTKFFVFSAHFTKLSSESNLSSR